ncbi:ACP S-malonyltransferase [Galactobacter caseinivorans]|uniref:[acyl-carrier-protein] S-malonyltransferase n=1 Tax=Galactobacter caseinivorans TaxID=2676123 RepID=A0A496PGW2_9MICC|nr:ACP S-malonyltransferase [Galactobacter caseinivorans]RKW69725.1 ACP S-malonyltransferase [Galactobacter caseinivorans]
MLAIVCPGQGSQTPGFLSAWIEDPTTAAHLVRLSDAVGRDLTQLGTTADEDTIKDTAVAQPLIVAAGVLTARALFGDNLPAGAVVAGHSVGEITASALTGALSEADAMNFVTVRANGMAQAAQAVPTGMSAVLGGDPDEVRAAIVAAGLTPANENGGGQIVAAGSLEQLAAFAENPPAKTRVIALKVAGAFHTEYMSPAVDALSQLAGALPTQDPSTTLLSNFDGAQVPSGAANLTSLVAQVTRPVRWDLCEETMLELGVTGLLELAPSGTLAGLAKRGMKGVKTFALKTPDQLEDARAFVAEHA